MLSDSTMMKFREALREHGSVAGGAGGRVSGSVSDGVQAIVHAAAVEARELGMTAAQFVIWVKSAWDPATHESMLSQTDDPLRARDAVISSAIKAYYVQ